MATVPPVIRPAAAADAARMAEIEQRLFAADAWSRAQVDDELARQTRWYAVADSDGAVMGYAGLYLSPPDADVQTVAVAPEAQGCGLGSRLLTAAVDAAWAAGCTRIFLEVRADNDAALALYDRAGFRRLGRRSRYYRDGTDAVTMRLRRNEPPELGVAHG